MSIKDISPEQRKEILEKGRIARKAAIEAGESLFHDFSSEDIANWKELHKKYGLRMPQKHIPNTETKHLKRTIKAVGADLKEYLEDCGVKTLAELVQMNDNWPSYSCVGFFLEWWDDRT